MNNYFLPAIIASALTISVVVIRQKEQAQNTSPKPSHPTENEVGKHDDERSFMPQP